MLGMWKVSYLRLTLQAVSCLCYLTHFSGSVSADCLAPMAQPFLLAQIMLLDTFSRLVMVAFEVGVLEVSAQCMQCSKSCYSGNDCRAVEGLILQEGFPCVTSTPIASSGYVDANPLCCLGHTCGVAN